MAIDPRTVRRIAELARLELTEEEVASYAADLEQILGHFEALAELDLESGDGPEDRGFPTRMRPDAPGADELAREPRDIAPSWRGDFFEVPRLEAMRDGEERS